MKREMIRGSFVGMLLWFALIAIVAPFVLSRTSPLWMLPGMVLAVVANFGYMAHVLRRNLARLEACSWHRCCWCEYDTTPIGDSGTCPECGREFSTSLLKADFQGLMDQLVWWMPKRWRTTFSGDAAGNATIDHAPLRAPQPGAKDYVDRSSTTSIGIGIIGSIVGFIGSGVIARLLQLKVGHSVFAILGVLAVAMLVNVAFQMPYLLYRRGRLSRRDWNICPWCEHDTRDIGREGTCPKCGGEFSAADLKADFDAACRHSAWMFWLRPDGGLRDSDKSPTQ